MDEWEKFNETSMAKEQSYSNLNMEDITDANYMHAKTVWKDFQIKNLSEYHNFFLKNETLLLADVFKNLKKMCLEIYQLDTENFFSATG